MAIATSTLLALGVAGISAAGALSEGAAAGEQADFQAADQIQRAIREKEIAAQSEEDFRRAQSRLFAESRAAAGGSGTDLSTGSNLLTAQDFAAETELQALRIRSGGATQASRLLTQATLTSAAGKTAKERGFFRAGSSLLSGASKTFST